MVRGERKEVFDCKERESEIVEAVIKWNYKQKEIADYLGLHYSTISKIVKNYSRFKN